MDEPLEMNLTEEGADASWMDSTPATRLLGSQECRPGKGGGTSGDILINTPEFFIAQGNFSLNNAFSIPFARLRIQPHR